MYSLLSAKSALSVMCLVSKIHVVNFLAAEFIRSTYWGLSPRLYLSFMGPSLADHLRCKQLVWGKSTGFQLR